MQVELNWITPNAADVIEHAARTCYDSHDKVKEGSAAKLIRGCLSKGHYSITEHASASFIVKGVSRSLLAQISRHRMLSFCVRSQRYVKEDGWGYVKPPEMTGSQLVAYCRTMDEIALSYEKLLLLGMKKEDARMVLPNACHTEFVVTANLRAWFEFCDKRKDRAAQWEIRELAETVYDVLAEEVAAMFPS